MEPISNEEVKQILQTGLPQAEVDVDGDGYRYRVTVISNVFAGKTLVQRHKLVYAMLKQVIAAGRLHALSLRTFTPRELTGSR